MFSHDDQSTWMSGGAERPIPCELAHGSISCVSRAQVILLGRIERFAGERALRAMFLRRALLNCVLALGMVGTTGAAHCEEQRVVVMEVSEGASGLDAEKLRSSVARELGAQVVSASDARASSAHGTLTVQIEADGAEVSVTYTARAVPLTRRLPLPADQTAAREAVVALAGNLARDEASALADELRRSRPAARPAPGPAASPAADNAPGQQARVPGQQAAALARLQATLDYYAEQDSSSRRVVGWTALGASGILAGAAVYIGAQKPDDQPVAAVATAIASASLAAGALATLLTPSSFEDLAEYGRRTKALNATERAWQMSSSSERKRRRIAGYLAAGGAALSLSAGTLALTTDWVGERVEDRYLLTGYFLGFGILDALLAAHAFSSSGPMESSFHLYQRSSGRTASSARPRRLTLRWGMSPTGGALAELSGQF
jgi:hypothetical protein